MASHLEGDRWRVLCQAGALRASRVVLATAAHAGDLWPRLAQTIAPMTSYQLATEPLGLKLAAQILPGDEACSDARNDLRYFRKDRGGRLISGRALAIQLMGAVAADAAR